MSDRYAIAHHDGRASVVTAGSWPEALSEAKRQFRADAHVLVVLVCLDGESAAASVARAKREAEGRRRGKAARAETKGEKPKAAERGNGDLWDVT